MKNLSMAKISVIVSVILFTILAAAIIIILNFSNNLVDMTAEAAPVRIGVVLNGTVSDRSWGQSHYDALVRVSAELGCELVYRENVPEDEASLDVISGFIETDKCSVIVATSFGYGQYMEQSAARYPDVYFLHASGSGSGRNLGSYFGRMYQPRYMSGIIAGLQTKTGKIGYTAAFPIDEVNRGINAFVLGVRSVNPDATVYVSFCNSWTDDDAAGKSSEKLISEYGIDVLAMHTNSLVPHDIADRNKVWSIGYNFDNSDLYPDTFLTACVWNWDVYYREQIRDCMDGIFHGEHEWLGYDSGIMGLVDPAAVGNAVPGYEEPLKNAAEKLRANTFDVFYGPVKDNTGKIRIAEGESMSDAAMLGSFDWYVEGVEIVG